MLQTARAGTDPIVFSTYTKVENTKYKSITVGGTAGYFMPFFNCAETTDTSAINILTDYYGDLDHGPVFQLTRATGLATFQGRVGQ